MCAHKSCARCHFFFLILLLFWVVVSCPVAEDCSKVSSSREFEAERVDVNEETCGVRSL